MNVKVKHISYLAECFFLYKIKATIKAASTRTLTSTITTTVVGKLSSGSTSGLPSEFSSTKPQSVITSYGDFW